MKKALICLMVILLLPALASAQTSVFDGYLFTGESVNVEDQSVLVHVDTGGKKVVFDYGTGIISVLNNSCDSTRSIKLCVDQIEWVQKTDRWRADVRVFSLVPEITITRSISDSDIRVGEETEISVTIANNGPVEASSAVYTDSFPDHIQIVREDGAAIEGNVVVWRGKIRNGESESFSYVIKPTKKIKADTFRASLNYFNGFKYKTLYTSTITLTATDFFDLTRIVQKNSILVGEEINITVNLTNFNPKAVKADFDFRVGDGLEVTNYRSIVQKLDEKTFKWSGEIRANRSQQLRFFLKGINLTPSAEVFYKARYTDYDGVTRETEEAKDTIKIEDKGVRITTSLNDLTIEAFQDKKLRVWVQNLNPYVAIKNVIVRLSSDFTQVQGTMNYDKIGKLERVAVVDKTFYARNVSVSTGGTLKVNVTYENEAGGSFYKELTDTVSVRPVMDVVITQEPGKAELEGGETTTMTVKLNNPRLTDIKNVAVSDVSSAELVKIGPTSKVVNIPREDTLTVYTYTIQAPKLKVEKKYYITTNIGFSQVLKNETATIPVSYTASKTTTITVKPKKLELTATKQLATSEVFIGEPFQVEYVITNPETPNLWARNIKIWPQPQREFDLVDATVPTAVRDLAPGESATITVRELNRAKFNTTQALLASVVTYTDENGNNWSANTSSISIDVKTKPLGISAPFVIVTKEAPSTANDTDEFDVTLNATNIGKPSTDVVLKDSGKQWKFTLDGNEQRIVSYKHKITSTGKTELAAAEASYSGNARKYLTGSNRPVVDVVQNPIVSVAQEVPETVNNIDSFDVKIKVRSLKPVSDAKITSGENVWNLPFLDGEKEFSYQKYITVLGESTIGAATATYVLDGIEYRAESEPKTVNVITKQVVALSKKVSSNSVKQGQDFEVMLTMKNNAEEPVYGIQLADEDKQWTVDLEPGEEKEFKYGKVLETVERVELAPATASYTYREMPFTISSNREEVTVQRADEAVKKPKAVAEEKPVGLVDTIIYYIKKVLTFKLRG